VLIQIGGNWCSWCIRFHDFYKNDAELVELPDPRETVNFWRVEIKIFGKVIELRVLDLVVNTFKNKTKKWRNWFALNPDDIELYHELTDLKVM